MISDVSLQLFNPLSMGSFIWNIYFLKISFQAEEAADSSDVASDAGPRRSSRIRSRPTTLQIARPEEEEELPAKKGPRKRRRKEKKTPGASSGVESDDDVIEVVSETVAPIFMKKKYQEEARAIKKAKQEFLFSGVPEVLKQQTVIQQALEQRPVEIFPKISHVTQAGSRPWALPYPTSLDSILQPTKDDQEIRLPVTFSSTLNSHPSEGMPFIQPVVQAAAMEWRYCKDWINLLKEEHGLTFPFFRTLRNLLSKASRISGEALWTDVYAPNCSADILPTNRQPAATLKAWLNQWKLRAGEDVQPEPKKKKTTKDGKKKRKRLDSEEDGSELEDATPDEKSNGSWKSEEEVFRVYTALMLIIIALLIFSFSFLQSSNSLLLVGPSGCGKTATVYALAEELGYNVLEVNTSSRRNGKTVLSHLHEATQSHSLNNTTPTASSSANKLFFGAPKPAVKVEEAKSSLSLVLFEDVIQIFRVWCIANVLICCFFPLR